MGKRCHGEEKMEEESVLFEKREVKNRKAYKGFALTVIIGIFMMWFYRVKEIMLILKKEEEEERKWLILILIIGIFLSEIGFGLYWIIIQSVRWRITHSFPLSHNLARRYKDSQLPDVDIFVCTADPVIEPPTLVISTVLSAMSYNYPTEKLSIYVSDDGGSELTFYALIEASHFSKHWLPFCRKFMVEPSSPEAYFSLDPAQDHHPQEWFVMKKLFEEMKYRIESVVEMGKVPNEIRTQYEGFSEWDNNVTKQNHQSIVKIIIDGKNVDTDGFVLPTLVYMAREKRPQFPHNFKAGAMNALIRVSTEISNAPFILNLDCDMYSNNPDTIRESLCFFLDEKRSHDVAFVQYPENFNNTNRNEIYGLPSQVTNEIELAGIDGYNAAMYCGTGCFHRRQTLCGMKYSKDFNGVNFDIVQTKRNDLKTVNELEEACKILADCNFENNSQWGKQMGLIYGCSVEDIITGLAIQCRGWKSIYYNPKKRAFFGVAPISLDVALIQFKRWSEGMFQIFLSKYCPFIYAHGKIEFGAQMGYCVHLLWAPLSLPTLYYTIVPPVCLIRGITLFPEVTSLWVIPFAYVFLATSLYGIAETIACGSPLKAWWNLRRMLLFRRTTAFFFGFIDTIIKQLGLSQTKFALTTKVASEDVSRRYEQEIMEFGSSNIMFTIIATLAMLNLFGLVFGVKNIAASGVGDGLNKFILQVFLCGAIVMINIPTYEALFIRKDKGNLPFSVLIKSVAIALLPCILYAY